MSTGTSGLPQARFSLTAPLSGGPRMGRTLWELQVGPDDERLWEAIPKSEMDLLRALVAAHLARRKFMQSEWPTDDDKWIAETASRAISGAEMALDALLTVAPHWGES